MVSDDSVVEHQIDDGGSGLLPDRFSEVCNCFKGAPLNIVKKTSSGLAAFVEWCSRPAHHLGRFFQFVFDTSIQSMPRGCVWKTPLSSRTRGPRAAGRRPSARGSSRSARQRRSRRGADRARGAGRHARSLSPRRAAPGRAPARARPSR